MSGFQGIKTCFSVLLLAGALFWTLPPLLLWLMNQLEGSHGMPPMSMHLWQTQLPFWANLGCNGVLWLLVSLSFKDGCENA